MRLVIGGPTRDTVPASFALDLAALYARTREEGPWTSVTMGFVQSTYVHVGRESVLAGALARQATHILWLDTDMAFPPDTALRLAAHNRSFVACNYVMRNRPDLFTAMRHGTRVATTEQSHGLDQVDVVAFGVLLMRTDVAAELSRPWFEHGRNAAGEDIGEDVMFCRRLRTTLWIDHDLSKEIGHVGQHVYRTYCAQVAV